VVVEPLAPAPRPARWCGIWPLLLVLTTLLNGAPFLAARVGWIDPAAYTRNRQRHCPAAGPPAGLVSACPAQIPDPRRPGQWRRLPVERLHNSDGQWRWAKLPRLLLLLALPLAALRACSRGQGPWPGRRQLLPALPLLASSALAALVTLTSTPPAVALVSLLPLLWLPLLLFAGPFATAARLRQWAAAAALLLLLQLPLLLLEAIRGLPMPFGPLPSPESLALPSRLVGSFIQPNSLGVAVLGLLGFALAYGPRGRRPLLLLLLALPPLLLGRAATGLVGWLLLALLLLQRRWPRLRWAVPALLAPVLLALPLLVQRPDLWRSPLGRLEALSAGMAAASPLQWLLGQGLHANSNQLLNLLGPEAALHATPSDGMPVLLLLQGGLFGLAAFYGLLLWAWWRDPGARPFLLAAGLGSLTLNITELFPLNLLLALSLHHSLLVAAPGPAAPATAGSSASGQPTGLQPQSGPPPTAPPARSSASPLPGG
jgi:hypothetical protein